MHFFPIVLFIPFVLFVIKAGGFFVSPLQSFLLLLIQFNISKTAKLYLDHHFIVCWNFNVSTTFTFLLHCFIKLTQMSKGVREVKLKLCFTKWFFYNLVILIKLYKIRCLNIDKALLFPRNQAISLKNWKLWRAPTTSKFNICCWNFAHVS